jgi:hypothetical protein
MSKIIMPYQLVILAIKEILPFSFPTDFAAISLNGIAEVGNA